MSGLKVLMLRKRLDSKKTELETLRSSVNFEKREKELEIAIGELNDHSTDEEKQTVEEEVEKFETEKKEHEEKVTGLEDEIRQIEGEIEEAEKSAPKPQEHDPKEKEEKRGGNIKMNTKTKFFGMSAEERSAFFNDENVKSFLSQVREAIKNKRAISNAGLLIPERVLGLLRENVLIYSKLYSRVHAVQVKGKGREIIMGTVPEAVWTEMCARLNELSLSFNDVEVDGFKVGGYFAVCRATLADSDIDLAFEIISALGQAIGLALDKAILYGKDVKMPLGVVTRLAQTTKPEDYPATAREWVNLSTTNIKKVTGTGIELFKNLLLGTGVVKGKYSRGGKLWLMNEDTYTKLVAEGMNTNMAGAIVSAVEGRMPVIGGDIEVFDFIPDGDIICGYFDLYLLAEREGTSIETSDHAMFIEDYRVFKGSARYDGTPVIAEAFALFNINNASPTTSIEFAHDVANSEDTELAALTIGNNKMYPTYSPSNHDYMVTTANATTTINAVAENDSAKIEIMNDDVVVENGKAFSLKDGINNIKIGVSYGGKVNTYNVTVTKTA